MNKCNTEAGRELYFASSASQQRRTTPLKREQGDKQWMAMHESEANNGLRPIWAE